MYAYYAVLRAIHQIEKCTKIFSNWANSLHFLLTEEKDVAEVRNKGQEDGQVLAFSISIGHSNSNFSCGECKN